MKNKSFLYVVILTIFFTALLTNPNLDRHKEVIKSIVQSNIQKSLKQNFQEYDDGWAKAGQFVSMMFGSSLIDQITDNIVSLDNYILFSITKVSWGGETNIIGIGAFGNVYITEHLDVMIRDYIDSQNEQEKENLQENKSEDVSISKNAPYLYGIPPAPPFREIELTITNEIYEGCNLSNVMNIGFIISVEKGDDLDYELVIQDENGVRDEHYISTNDMSNAERSYLPYILIPGNKILFRAQYCGSGGFPNLNYIKTLKRFKEQ